MVLIKGQGVKILKKLNWRYFLALERRDRQQFTDMVLDVLEKNQAQIRTQGEILSKIEPLNIKFGPFFTSVHLQVLLSPKAALCYFSVHMAAI